MNLPSPFLKLGSFATLVDGIGPYGGIRVQAASKGNVSVTHLAPWQPSPSDAFHKVAKLGVVGVWRGGFEPRQAESGGLKLGGGFVNPLT